MARYARQLVNAKATRTRLLTLCESVTSVYFFSPNSTSGLYLTAAVNPSEPNDMTEKAWCA